MKTIVLSTCFSHGAVLLNCYTACFRLVATLAELGAQKIHVLGTDPKRSLTVAPDVAVAKRFIFNLLTQ